jgi:hypothetical protein
LTSIAVPDESYIDPNKGIGFDREGVVREEGKYGVEEVSEG